MHPFAKFKKILRRVFLAGHIVGQYDLIGQFFDTTIVASIDKEW